MSSQKFTSFPPTTLNLSLLPTGSNILQPKRLNTNKSSEVPTCRRVLGQKGQLSSNNSNGISHLSNQQLTSLLSRHSPILEAQNIGNSNGGIVILPGHCNTPIITSSSPGITNTVRPTPGRRAPNTMAKRNARERNRVKQVNQGFQTLRHHIPESYRMKKMSKVDTLRCALDYIRNLERILQLPEDMESYSTLDNSITNNLSSSTSIIFSSEEEDLFVHGESPTSSFHQEHLSLLNENNANNKNNNVESGNPVFVLNSSNNKGNNDEDGIMICPPEDQQLSATQDDNYTIDVIRVSISPHGDDLDHDNGMLSVSPLSSDSEIRTIPESSEDCCGQSHGHYSDGHSDIENFENDEETKFHY